MTGWALGAPEVFISYARAGQCEVAKRLHKAVAARDWVPLRDLEDIDEGTQWRGTIHGWLDSCDVAVVLMCPEAKNSAWVADEVSILSHRFLRPGSDLEALLVVRFGAVDLAGLSQGRGGAANLPEIESTLQLGVPEGDQAIDQAVDKIVTAIAKVLGRRPGVAASSALRNRAEFHAFDRLPTAPLQLKRICSTLVPERRLPQDVTQLLALAAVELCRAADLPQGIDAVFRSLPEPGHAYRLVELNLATFFDGQVCGRVWDAQAPLVLAVTDALAARIAIDAAISGASKKDFAEFDVIEVNVVADAAGEAAQAARLAADVREELAAAASRGEARPGARDPGRYLSTRRGGDDRVFVVLNVATSQAAERVTPAVIAGLVGELGAHVVLVFACPDPAALAARLGTDVCGPAEGEARASYVELGAHLVNKRNEYLDWLESTWDVTDPGRKAA